MYMYGDNISVIPDTSKPESTLKKKCNAIAYHAHSISDVWNHDDYTWQLAYLIAQACRLVSWLTFPCKHKYKLRELENYSHEFFVSGGKG